MANTRVGRAGSVRGGAVASGDATTSAGVPDAAGVAVASVGAGVSHRTLGNARRSSPFANGGLLALISSGVARARLCAGACESVPCAGRIEVAGSFSEVSSVALLLAHRGVDVPAAARLLSAGCLTLNETASLLASGLLSVPLTVGVVDARRSSGVFLRALEAALGQFPHAHGLFDASVLDLISGVAGHRGGGVDVAIAAALTRGGVPHAVGVAVAGNGSGVLDAAGGEAASETRGSVDEHAASVGDAVSGSVGDGDGFAGADAVSTNPGAIAVASALILRLDLGAVSQALSVDPVAS